MNLFLLMGLMYTFELSGSVFKYPKEVWYVIGVVGLLQVFMWFACLICRQKVLKAIKESCHCCH